MYGGGGQPFSKTSEIQKSLNYPKGMRGGGGGEPNSDIVTNFSVFLANSLSLVDSYIYPSLLNLLLSFLCQETFHKYFMI